MNLFKGACLWGIACAFAMSQLSAASVDGKTSFDLELADADDLLRSFINSKRKMPVNEKGKLLKISGDVHSEWEYTTEKLNGKVLRIFDYQAAEAEGDDGLVFVPGTSKVLGRYNSLVRFDLYVDWDYKKTWARSDIRVQSSVGVNDNGESPRIDPQGYHGSGDDGKLKLREAYVGYEIFKCGDDRFTVELGRRGNIYKVFNSELQFGSRLDGIIAKFTTTRGGLGNAYFQAAAFVIDQSVNHFGWVAEIGIDNIRDTGLDAKYSFIDWRKGGPNRYFVRTPLGMRFQVSQWSLNYTFAPKILGGKPVEIVGAFLMNHIPAKYTYVDGNDNPLVSLPYLAVKKRIGKQNRGGYIGVQYRSIANEGDWLFKTVAAFCEAQCIPDEDVRNIGNGNGLDESFTAWGRGNTNWKGYYIKFGYAITDNFVIETQYDRSWALDASIAGSHSWNRCVVETTYSF